MKLSASEFRHLTRTEKVEYLVQEGLLPKAAESQLLADSAVLPFDVAEHMIENVIGVFGLPLAIVPNVLINGREYDIPMAIEEPSVVAAQSNAAKLVRLGGGYKAYSTEAIMIGQVQLIDIPDIERAISTIELQQEQLIKTANQAIPRMVQRGGGVRDLTTHAFKHPDDKQEMLIVHLHIDVLDAMGANLINTVAEAIAPMLEDLSKGKAVLRILSNLSDGRRASAEASIPIDALAIADMTGQQVAEGIVWASKFAEVDPNRAATHNKGVMNGIDAVVIATGNDFRAVEAAAHAWCCRDGHYGSLTTWRIKGDALVGRIELPLALSWSGSKLRWCSRPRKHANAKAALEPSPTPMGKSPDTSTGNKAWFV